MTVHAANGYSFGFEFGNDGYEALTAVEFAARRRVVQDDAITALLPVVTAWIEDLGNAERRQDLFEALTELYTAAYLAEDGLRRARTAFFLFSLGPVLRHTTADSDPQTVATRLAVTTLNAAVTQAAADAPEPFVLRWTTMHDSHVRHAHAEAEGQRRPPGSLFLVGGESLRYPGDPRGRPENTINCRCIAQPIMVTARTALQAAAEKETVMPISQLAWHGVLAPEGEWSGDGRMFATGALRNRDLPLPLTWQKATSDGHDGSVVVGRIDAIERVGNLVRGEGVFIDTPETDEVVGLIAEFGRFGVSIDADDSEFEFDEGAGKVTFTSARIASASLVSIPAFKEAFVALGTWAEADDPYPRDEYEDECDPDSEEYQECVERKRQAEKTPPEEMSLVSGEGETFIDEGTWDGSAGRFTPAQWKASCVLHVCTGDEKSCHKLPVKTPGGALSRAGVHAAAARFNQVDAPPEAKASAARALRGAYRQLGEEVPDVLKAAGETDTFKRGPGWITNPEDTRRIWAYWTQPGHEGYAKINWGHPGDFNRCRVLVGEKIAANSPEDLRFLNQICAQWHHDATGFWPGRAPTEQVGSVSLGKPGTSVTLVAAAPPKAPASWFADPQLSHPTHLTVTEEGRVFGHLAQWGVCHIGLADACVTAPHSLSGYAYFATGTTCLDDGTSANTGVISLGGGHAGARLGARQAAAHYDSTSTAVADVAIGEDEHGIWVAGWVRPGVGDEQVVALRASDVSGDWREIGGNLELVAALSVNVAGFPVAAVQNKVQVALVAAGVVGAEDDPVATLDKMIGEHISAALRRRDRMEQLRERVGHAV